MEYDAKKEAERIREELGLEKMAYYTICEALITAYYQGCQDGVDRAEKVARDVFLKEVL